MAVGQGRTSEFFDSYASDFNAIYGTNNKPLTRLINSLLRRSMRLRFERTLEYCNPIDGRSVIDIGCGPGHFSIALARKGAESILGVDFAEGMIEIARKNAQRNNVEDKCEWILGDFEQMQIENRYNYCIVMGFMDYIEDPRALIKKVAEITTDKAFFSFPVADGLLAWQRKLRYRSRCPLYMYSKKQIEAIFTDSIGKRVKIERISRDFFVTLTI